MNRTGRPSPPFHVWFTLGFALFILGRGIQDIAHDDITSWTWFRLGAAAWLAWSGTMEWRKHLRRQSAPRPPRPPEPPSEEP